MTSKMLPACVCLAVILSCIGTLSGDIAPSGETLDFNSLGGLWNPDGPTESATTRIVRPETLLAPGPGSMPSAVDNSAGLPPVGNQLSQGSCTCWAIGYYHATYIENRESPFDLSDPNNQVSPGFLYHIANGGYDGGSYMEDVADLIISNGAPSMAEMPYNAGDDTSWPAEDWIWVSGMKRRAVSQNWIDLHNSEGLEALKAHLAAGNTATTGIDVYGNFDSIEEYNYTYCSSETTGTNRGGHIVTIVGYDDDKATADGMGAFRMVNSWGTDWGEAGFWWMSYTAIADDVLGYGWSMHLESELNYAPSMVAKAAISHQERGDIVCGNGLSVGVQEDGHPLGEKPFLSCFYIEDWYANFSYPVQRHPFPAGAMAFDISEFLPLMDTGADHSFQLYMANADSLTGDLLGFDILIPATWEGGVCEGLPITVEPYSLTEAETWTHPGIYSHSPIRADGDDGLAHRAIGEFWQGTGTPGNPYLLHDYIIDGTDKGNCIYIGNTTAHFAISDCTLDSASGMDWSDWHMDTGIFLNSASNGTLQNNIVNANMIGMFSSSSGSILAEGNEFSGNAYGMIVSVCTDMLLRGNNITDSTDCGLMVEYCDDISIYHNNFLNNTVQAYDDGSLVSWDAGYPSQAAVAGENVTLFPVNSTEWIFNIEVNQDAVWSQGTPEDFVQMLAGANYTYHLNVSNMQLFDIWINGMADAPDLDLGIFLDGNNGQPLDGALQWQEIVTADNMEFQVYNSSHAQGYYCECADEDANEGIRVLRPQNGHYFVKVLGFNIPTNPGHFNIRAITQNITTGMLAHGNIDAGSERLILNELGTFTAYRTNASEQNPVYVCNGTELVPWGFALPFLPNYGPVNLSLYDEMGTPEDTSDDVWESFDTIGFVEGTDYAIDYGTGNVTIMGFDGFTGGYLFANYSYQVSSPIAPGNYTLDAATGEIAFDPPLSGQCIGVTADYNYSNEGLGNYWSDYNGTDHFSGPAQDLPGSDGVGDTPYTDIDGGMGAQDNYPLMGLPGSPEPVRLYLQVQNSAMPGYRNLSFEPFEAEPQTASTSQVSESGNYMVQSRWLSEPLPEDADTSGNWTFDMYGHVTNVSLLGGYLFARIYRYGNSELLFETERDDENVSAYAAYHHFSWTHASPSITVNASDRYYVEIWLDAQKYGGAIAEQTPNPDFTVGTDPWTFNNWGGATGGWASGSVSINVFRNDPMMVILGNGGYWQQAFNPSDSPVSAALSFSWRCSGYSNLIGANFYVFIDSFPGTPDIGDAVWSTAALGITPWMPVGPIDVSQYLNSASTYYLKIAAMAGTPGGTISTFQGVYDNVLLTWNVLPRFVLAFDSGSTPSSITGSPSGPPTPPSGLTIEHSASGEPPFADNLLSWTHDGTCFVERFNVYRSESEYGPWEYVSSVPSGTYQYTDTGTGRADTVIWWYIVRAQNAAGEEYNCIAAREPDIGIFTVNLTAGWNLISIPLGMSGSSVENVLSSVSGSWDAVKYYDPSDVADPWKTFRPSGTANDLASVDRTMGLWLHATENCTLSVEGEAEEITQITLRAGWNLVGYPSLVPAEVSDALYGTNADRVECFEIAYPGMVREMGPGELMMPGHGYWVHAIADSVWTVSW